ncbi:general transcription factor II-I repeat domain-containing protein 2B-like [Ambystoma mexicanum]|uniref:general transcription factor II-I repeat domain-containing protein 2B-like n=1 Tax=Ambystoma mexicanum TaxID=8296 RepID=UPI0037E8FCD1
MDVKILAKPLANRLVKHLPSLLHGDQVGFIPGRQGSDNVQKTLDLMHEVSRQEVEGYLLSLDSEKAFDRVEWPYMGKSERVCEQVTASVHVYNIMDEWEEQYFFTSFKGKAICLICQASVSVGKKCNLERHFNTVHKSYDIDYPTNSNLRRARVKELKTALSAQQSIFKKTVSHSKAATVASLKVAHILAKKKKPFEDGEIVKEAMLATADSLFQDFKNYSQIIAAIKDVQLSGNTVVRRIEVMSEDVDLQLRSDLEKCDFMSLQFDESTDIEDTAQLSIFIRMVFEDSSVKEDILAVLVAVTTDGALAMVGRNIGFVALCRRDPDFPEFRSYHCIIHQQSLCSKVLNYQHVMTVILKIVNSIRARSLQNRLFKSLLDEMDAQYGFLLFHTEVRWLSRGKVLPRFLDLLPEIIVFLEGRGDQVEQLSNPKWLSELAFLNDLTSKLNALNLELQGQDKTITELIGSVNAFKVKLNLWMTQMEKGILTHFPSLEKLVRESAVYEKDMYAEHLDLIRKDFEKRFSDFLIIEPVATFITNPFMETDVTDTASQIANAFRLSIPDLEMEIITLQADLHLKARSSHTEIWAMVQKSKYPLLKQSSQCLLACFGSTYLCESGFSTMKILKSKYRSRLTNTHLNDCMKLAVTHYTANFDKLAENMQCQVSH